MEIVAEGDYWLTIRPCQPFLDFLTANGIRSSEFGPHAWTASSAIHVWKDTPVERWVGVYAGDYYPRYGGFSYSYSALGIGTSIGRYCSVSWGVRVMGPNHAHWYVTSSEMMYRHETAFAPAFAHYGVDWTFRPNPQKPDPVIGHDVWIGQDVLLARGIRLGNGCVIAAGSVVTKDVAPYAVMGGVPARMIRWRFAADVIADLQRLCWWDYALPQLNHLSLDDPQRFVGEFADLLGRGTIEPMRPLGRAEDIIRSFL